MLGAANYGVLAGLGATDILSDLQSIAAARGGRHVPEREIRAAIEHARATVVIRGGNKATSNSAVDIVGIPGPKLIVDPNDARQRIIQKAVGITDTDILAASPIRISPCPAQKTTLVLRALYTSSEKLFIGARRQPGIAGTTLRTASAWISHFAAGGGTAEHIIANPLTGKAGLTLGGKKSFRADSCVSSFRFAVCEFDDLTRDQQLAFWSGVSWPVAALIDSGGKSIHAWLDVRELAENVNTPERWHEVVEKVLYGELLVPLGVDPSCKNEARLSRLPGHFRRETNRWQSLLFLSPRGKVVLSK